MKTIVSALATATCFFCFHASAQEAIPNYTPGSTVGYTANGAGYAFSPVVPMEVTSLGFDGSDLSHENYEVGLFNASGTQLATAAITTASTFYNQTYYQSISPVYLIPGDTYYIGAVAPASGDWVGNIVGPGLGGSFLVNADITYLGASAGFMPPGSFSPSTPNSSYFYIDENFEFTVVPEPSVLSLLGVAGILATVWRRRLLS